MEKSIYDQLGGFTFVRKLISSFYDKVLENDNLAALFGNSNMERIIDHQTKFFASLLGGPVSFTDDEIRRVHERLRINDEQFDETSECLSETLEDYDLSDEHIELVSSLFESKRALIVHAG